MAAVKNSMYDLAETLERGGSLPEHFEQMGMTRDDDKLTWLFESFVYGLEAEIEYPDEPLIRALFTIAYSIKHENFMNWLETMREDA